MPTPDWNDFISDITWAVQDNEIVHVADETCPITQVFNPTDEFVKVFPHLTNLVNAARVTKLQIGAIDYCLLGWTGKNGQSLGWQCLLPETNTQYNNLHADHTLLATCFGGIKERWNEPETWLCNLNSALCPQDIKSGLSGWEEYYSQMCESEGCEQAIDTRPFVAFAPEANGDFTAYHQQTGEVIMFAHDHCFDHITPLPGCPEYTLYAIDGCPDFRTWVETVARQWLDHIDNR